jgi:hypothetical protein
VNCSEANRFFSGNNEPLAKMPSELERHVGECPQCRALSALFADTVAAEPVPQSTLIRLQASILADLTAVRPLWPARLYLLVFLAIFLVTAGIGAYRLGPSGWPLLTAFQRTGVFTSIAIGAGLLGFSLTLQMVPASKYLCHPALLPVGAFALLLLVIALVFQVAPELHFLRAGLWCLRAGVPYETPAAIAFFLVMSRGVVLSLPVAGMTTGALAGLVGVAVLEVHCPNLDVLHIMAFHLGVLAIGIVMGLIFGIAGEYLTSGHWTLEENRPH